MSPEVDEKPPHFPGLTLVLGDVWDAAGPVLKYADDVRYLEPSNFDEAPAADQVLVVGSDPALVRQDLESALAQNAPVFYVAHPEHPLGADRFAALAPIFQDLHVQEIQRVGETIFVKVSRDPEDSPLAAVLWAVGASLRGSKDKQRARRRATATTTDDVAPEAEDELKHAQQATWLRLVRSYLPRLVVLALAVVGILAAYGAFRGNTASLILSVVLVLTGTLTLYVVLRLRRLMIDMQRQLARESRTRKRFRDTTRRRLSSLKRGLRDLADESSRSRATTAILIDTMEHKVRD